MAEIYDVIIIGSGPAGIFCALELIKENNKNLKIAMLEKGVMRLFDSCDKTSGFGGAGAFSDGKLNLTGEVGGDLINVINSEEYDNLVKYVDNIYVSFVTNTKLFQPEKDFIDNLERQCLGVGLKLIHFPVRHLGTDGCYQFTQLVEKKLKESIVIIYDFDVINIERIAGVYIIKSIKGETIKAKRIVAGVGRSGVHKFMPILKKMGVNFNRAGLDIGVRVEIPSKVISFITDKIHEIKLFYNAKQYRDTVRTFCMCPGGFVVTENYKWFNQNNLAEEILTVNGHSYAYKKSNNTNFAILVHQEFTEPFGDQLAYARDFAKAANQLSKGKVLIQSLGDIRRGQRSTPERIKLLEKFIKPTLLDAIPGDLSLAIYHRFFVDIIEMLDAMGRMIPGLDKDYVLLYGNEVKFYCNKPKANDQFEVLDDFYVIGDGSGWTRGLMQASIHGIIAARNILSKK